MLVVRGKEGTIQMSKYILSINLYDNFYSAIMLKALIFNFQLEHSYGSIYYLQCQAHGRGTGRNGLICKCPGSVLK